MAPRASDSSGRPKDTSRDRPDVGAASARQDGPKPVANDPTRGPGLVRNSPNSNVPQGGSKPAAEPRHSDSGFEIASMIVISGVAVIGYQAYYWLRYGIWKSLSLWLVWNTIADRPPMLEWRGAEKIVHQILDLPVSGVLVIVGIFTALFASWWSERERSSPRR
jgi:hypothetical protein